MGTLTAAGARGGFATLIAQGTTLAARFLTTILLARLLVPEYFGLVAVVAACTEFAAAVIQFGLPLAAAQEPSLSTRAKSTLFFINTSIGLVFSVAFLIGAGLVADLYGNSELTGIVRWLSIVPITVGLCAQYQAQLMADLRFVTLTIIFATVQIVGMVAAVTVAATTGSVYALVVHAVLPYVVLLPWLAISARWRPSRPGDWKESRRIIAVGSRIFGLGMLRNLSRTAIVPVLGLVETPRNVGYYDRAYQLSATPANTLMDSLQFIAVPLLARVRSDSQKLQSAFEKAQAATTIALVCPMWVIAVLAEPLTVLALGEEWLPAGEVMQLLAVAAGFRLLGMTQQWLFIAGEATGAGLVFSAWAQPLVVVMSLAGLPWGILGVAASSAVAWALFWPLSTLAAAKSTGLSGKHILAKAAITVASFSAPVALAAMLPGFLLSGLTLTIFAGLASAVVAACILILIRPSLRQTVSENIAAVRGKQ